MVVEYYDNHDLAIYNGYSFRRDKKTGYYLSSKPIGKHRKRLHVYVFECENGKITKGYEVHHKDHDKDNNEPDNLILLIKKEHLLLHSDELTAQQKEKRRKNIIERAMPKAKEWHGSKEGKDWHSKHAKEIYENLPLSKYTCTFCGADFETKNVYADSQNRFCSNKCKSAYRRKMGFDNIEMECAYCGARFITNKYSGSKYCEYHRNRKNRV